MQIIRVTTMQVGVGYGDHPDSMTAGKQAAKEALAKVGSQDPCDLVLLFGTARHDQEVLRETVAEVTGNSCCIYGGGAVGVITNDHFGYAGDQVGVACIWLEEGECNVFVEDGLLESEMDTGVRLGKQLAQAGVKPDSPVMLFYGAIDQTQENMRLLMATWILEGIEKGLGFLPDIMGAGMQGDHLGSSTEQYLGDSMGSHSAFAMTFSDDIQIDHVIMHGCQPASPYYTVTKSEGPVILEINGEPALDFMDGLLGAELKPEDYPFFLLFGINHSGRWGESDEDNYASRLCLGIDKEHKGIVMFEPDMVAGTQFQVMFRSLGLNYMNPKIRQLFNKLDEREPIFAVYIDCAGRCAGYGGIEMEDAYIIQDAVRGRMPLLGLYTGVEIASSGGRPRGLDWTGVLCVFSKGKKTNKKKTQDKDEPAQASAGEPELTMDEMKRLCEQSTAKVLSLDAQTIALRHELEQKRNGFGLLAELAVSLRQGNGSENIFFTTARRMNAALNMQKTVVLIPDGEGGYMPTVMQGYSPDEKLELSGRKVDAPAELLDMEKPALVNGADSNERMADLREVLKLPYFVSVPVVIENKIAAILITGRMMEAPPFMSRLTGNDVETVQAISALLGSVLMHQKLDDANKLAQTDGLTGLYNRRALEWQTTELLNRELAYGKMSAFIMIDIDYFKEVNDEYGHLEGDRTLKALAKMLRDNFRATDIIARLGGDEFAMYCTLTADAQPLIEKVSRLVKSWSDTPIHTKDGRSFNSTLSIGIAVAPRDGIDYKELLHKADIALYKSKKDGRNRYTLYDARTMKG